MPGSKVLPAVATAGPLEIDDKHALRLVMELMAIPGLSGREGRVVQFITRKLREAGLPESAIEIDDVHRRSPLGGEVGNLIVKLPGTMRGPRRLLTAHMDTVPLCEGCQPAMDGEFVRSANRSTGLGADDRSGAGAILAAALEILRRRLPHPPLTLFWPVQEEVGLYGARFVRIGMLGNPKLCFNWDGDGPQTISVGATGAYRLQIDVGGVASHAGVAPEKGVSAIGIASLAIADLQREGWHGLIRRGSRLGTSNVGVICGGTATNVVTPQVSIKAEARSHDPKFRRQIVEAFRRAFRRAAQTVRSSNGMTGRVQFHEDLHYESFRLGEDEPVVQAARRAIRTLGMEPQLKVSNGGLDANWLCARGLPTVTLGAGQRNVHTVNEVLHVPSYLMGCRVALTLALGNETR